MKRRPGSCKVPRWLFQKSPLSSDERFLLMYFHSHAQSSWTHNVDKVRADLGWGRQKYYENRKSLVKLGLLRIEIVRKLDPETGKLVPDSFLAFTDLSAENHNLELGPECRKSASSKSSLLSTSIDKGRSASDVIDDGDVAWGQDAQPPPNRRAVRTS